MPNGHDMAHIRNDLRGYGRAAHQANPIQLKVLGLLWSDLGQLLSPIKYGPTLGYWTRDEYIKLRYGHIIYESS